MLGGAKGRHWHLLILFSGCIFTEINFMKVLVKKLDIADFAGSLQTFSAYISTGKKIVKILMLNQVIKEFSRCAVATEGANRCNLKRDFSNILYGAATLQCNHQFLRIVFSTTPLSLHTQLCQKRTSTNLFASVLFVVVLPPA
jgi:hypothetical protein